VAKSFIGAFVQLFLKTLAAIARRFACGHLIFFSPIALQARRGADYPPVSRSSRLAQVLLEQLEVHEQAPLELPELSDPRAERVAAMLRADPADRRPLAELAAAAGANHRTIERLFASETQMSFGRWRVRHRMITALEQLAHGDSVSNVAYAVGYETPSSFIAAFRATFGTTPTAYFQDTHDRTASRTTI
jgi:AraC-like DNA-binding protein